MSYLLHPSQRKQFTITKGEATDLARKLAYGDLPSLTFQSYANRNWVAKIARTQFGININSYKVSDQLLDPRYTVEGRNTPDRGIYNEKHWMTVYKAEVARVPAPVIHKPRTFNSQKPSWLSNSYVNEGNIW